MNESIRSMGAGDVAEAAALVTSAFERRLWPFMTVAQHGIEAFLSVPIQFPASSPGRHQIVATGPGGVRGYADFRVSNARDGFLSNICIAPRAAGQGVATALIEWFLSNHPELTEMQLDVFQHNQPAIGLYRKLKFVSRGSVAWVTRDLPPASTPVRIEDLPVSLAAHRAYGFCELRVHWGSQILTVGLLGDTVVKCHAVEEFELDALLAALRATFPDVERAFVVVSLGELPRLTVAHTVLLLSDRMVLRVGSTTTEHE
jgi:GNAT superfamily N-acetyltransferase